MTARREVSGNNVGAFLIGQSNAFEVAAALGILGAIISAQRGPDVRPEGR